MLRSDCVLWFLIVFTALGNACKIVTGEVLVIDKCVGLFRMPGEASICWEMDGRIE